MAKKEKSGNRRKQEEIKQCASSYCLRRFRRPVSTALFYFQTYLQFALADGHVTRINHISCLLSCGPHLLPKLLNMNLLDSYV